MKTINNFLKFAFVIFLFLSVGLWVYVGYCDDGEEGRLTSYSYNPTGKPDPFKPFIEITAGGKLEERLTHLTPLQRYGIEEFRLVGVVCSNGKRIAMVENSAGKTYFLYKGTRIGINKGRVVKILSDQVIVEESFESPSGKIDKQRVVLQLRTEEFIESRKSNGGKP
jgi:type IV pilus assembly protein PilP